MVHRPKALVALSVFLIGVAVGYPVQIMLLYEHGLSEIGAVLAKVTPMNWLVMMGSVVCAVLAYRASPRLWTAYPILSIVVAWNNMLVSELGDDYSPFTTAMATLGFAGIGGLLFTADAWELMRHPEKRWWLRPVRKQISAPVFIIPQQGESFRAETFDVSNSGAFVRVTNRDIFSAIKAGDKISLRMTVGALTVLRCEAQIVRRDTARGCYPDGLGIQFRGMKRSDARELRKYLRSY